ncbi:hypothetical protein E2C01_034692 [Portunus trituberculatus]|uniref:Uncharacterized protein n=1 Tax=Portunus trituberculatus TaxID=210409 RepID=A0A5B7F7L3_PORTR|nr:hypothetical protein [Portunus trituberculatus]
MLRRLNLKSIHPSIRYKIVQLADTTVLNMLSVGRISIRICANFLDKVPGGMDEIPKPISVVCHKLTWRRYLADFWN